jgi:hypothetical protein
MHPRDCWALALFFAIYLAIGEAAVIPRERFRPDNLAILILLVALILCFSGIALRIHIRNRRMNWRKRHGLCEHCGYDLRAGHARCPECGHDRV